MDKRLVAWARAVKARRRHRSDAALPVLWLLTDAARLTDPRGAIAALPKFISGVVFRHDGHPGRAALGRDIARLCRQRSIALTVAGDWRLARALGAGQHLRASSHAAKPRPGRGLITASAHGRLDVLRACRRGADAIFLSPVFRTASHPSGKPLGAIAWAAAARGAGGAVLALGGIDGRSIRQLALTRCAGAGAIGAIAGVIGRSQSLCRASNTLL